MLPVRRCDDGCAGRELHQRSGILPPGSVIIAICDGPTKGCQSHEERTPSVRTSTATDGAHRRAGRPCRHGSAHRGDTRQREQLGVLVPLRWIASDSAALGGHCCTRSLHPFCDPPIPASWLAVTAESGCFPGHAASRELNFLDRRHSFCFAVFDHVSTGYWYCLREAPHWRDWTSRPYGVRFCPPTYPAPGNSANSATTSSGARPDHLSTSTGSQLNSLKRLPLHVAQVASRRGVQVTHNRRELLAGLRPSWRWGKPRMSQT